MNLKDFVKLKTSYETILKIRNKIINIKAFFICSILINWH